MEIAVNNDRFSHAVHSTLQYHALFRYPLSAAEIHARCQAVCSVADVEEYLHEESLKGNVFRSGDFYTICNDADALVARRKAGNLRAVKDLKLAGKIGRFLYQFPFVQFVGISGSLSKGYADAKSDFDFFIITKENKLWICRTFLHLFKKLTFLAGQQHKFCMNYFIDERAYRLEEKNIYTATELSSLIPICGKEAYEELALANQWVDDMLPNTRGWSNQKETLQDRKSWFSRAFTAIADFLMPDAVNSFLMKLTDRKWHRKWDRKGYPQEDYRLAFKTTLHISKNHPANYQKKILEQINKKRP
ncbi:hypothetical protein ACTHGU_17920 [Chitinophagaceae bacterium MMS25-I14]